MNAQASFITDTSGAEKLLGINSRGLANTHTARISAYSFLGGGIPLKSGAFADAFINGGMGLSIEDLPFVRLERGGARVANAT